MLWFVIFLACLLLCLGFFIASFKASTVVDRRSTDGYGRSNTISNQDHCINVAIGFLVPIIILTVVFFCFAVNIYSTHFAAVSAYTRMETITAQRQDLIKLVSEGLAADEYKDYMNLTDSDAAVVLLRDRGVSEVMITKIKMIVALNNQYLAIRNQAMREEIELCNIRHNPLYPQIPKLGPDCSINILDSIPFEPTVYDGS